jgi:hypothetical protein
MIISRVVAVAIKLGYACIRSAEGTITLATDGSVVSFPAFAERPDVGTSIAATLTTGLVVGDIGRETYVKLGGAVTENGYGMPTSDGTWIAATATNYVGVQLLKSGASGDVVPAIAVSFKLP